MKPIFCIAVLITFFAACNNPEESHKGHENHQQVPEKVYTCPMHPEVIRDKPGQCPICGMNLVEKDGGGGSGTDTSLGFLLRPTNQFVLSEIKTIRAQARELPVEFTATGSISYDTRSVNIVSSRVSGRIDKLYIKYRFQPVAKGDKLMDIYSKDLVTAQENYLFLLKNDSDNHSMIAAAENKLALMGLSPMQVSGLKNSGKVLQSITLYSPYSGHLHEAPASSMEPMNNFAPPQDLSVREGMYVSKGQAVFNIYSTGRVWAVLNAPAAVQALLQPGEVVELTIDGVKDTLKGDIDFIEPLLRSDQKTATVRVQLDNPGGEIKIGAIARGLIEAGSRKGLYVPASAVLSLGLNSVVFIKRSKVFEAKIVGTGIHTSGWVEITTGLGGREEVAENAQLLMDSESFVKAGLP